MNVRAGRVSCASWIVGIVVALCGHGWASDSVTPRQIYAYEESGLEFGKLAMLAPLGEVRVTPQGERVISPELVDLGGYSGPAILTLYGEPNRPFAILMAKVVRLRGSSVPNRLVVRDVTTKPSQIGTFAADGTATVYVGGNLTLPGWSRDGEYRGRASVWIKYL